MAGKRVSTPSRIAAVLGTRQAAKSALGHILTKAAQATAISRALEDLLPPALRGNVSVVNLDEHQLLLAAHNPAQLTMLRFTAPKVLAGLRKSNPKCTAVQVKTTLLPYGIRPAPVPVTAPRAPLTPATAAHILSAADHIRDPTLAAALRRLAKHSVPTPAKKPQNRR